MKAKRWLNNNLLPVSYNLWREEQDETYYKITNSLRSEWISTQQVIYSSMNVPTLFFAITLCFGLLFSGLKMSPIYFKYFYVLFSIGLIWFLINLLLLNRCYDAYCDEKFIELSEN